MAHRYLIECDSKKQANGLEQSLAEFTARTSNNIGGPYRHAEATENPILYQKNYPTLTMAGACIRIELLTGEKIADDFFAGEWKLKEEPQEVYSAEYKFNLFELGELTPTTMVTHNALVFLHLSTESPLNLSHFEKFKSGLLEIMGTTAVNITFRDEQQHHKDTVEQCLQEIRKTNERIRNQDYNKKDEPVRNEPVEYPLVKLFCPFNLVCVCNAQGPIEKIVDVYTSLKNGLKNSWLLRRKWKIDDSSEKYNYGLQFY